MNRKGATLPPPPSWGSILAFAIAVAVGALSLYCAFLIQKDMSEKYREHCNEKYGKDGWKTVQNGSTGFGAPIYACVPWNPNVEATVVVGPNATTEEIADAVAKVVRDRDA